MEIATIIISIFALFLSGLTFYWVNIREKKQFYLLPIYRMFNFSNPEFALVNSGSKHLLVTKLECGFVEKTNRSTLYPEQKAEIDGSESSLIEAGHAARCVVKFTGSLSSSMAKKGELKENSTPPIYMLKLQVNVSWIDANGNNYDAIVYPMKYGLSEEGSICLTTPVEEKCDLLAVATRALTIHSSRQRSWLGRLAALRRSAP